MKRSAARQRYHQSNRQAVLVLGMHRSGTSALSGVACALGASAPNNLLPANFANPSGYWESLPLVQANNELLASASSSWDDWRRLDPQWYESDEARRFRGRFQDIVKSEYDAKPLFIIKDPRLCRLMPFFLSVLEDMTIAPVALLSIRDPLEVAFSLRRRDGFSISKSVALWLRHVLEAELHSRQMPRCFISYENLLKDWRLEMGRASDTTGIAWPVDPETAAISVERFLAADLHHERNESAEVERHADLLFLAAETYDLLREASRVGPDRHLLRKIDVVRENFDQASSFFGAILHTEETLLAGLDAAGPSDTAGVPVNEFQHLNTAPFERSHQGGQPDGALRHRVMRVSDRDKRLPAANEELRRLVSEVAERDRRLGAADRDLRRLMDEVEDRERRLGAADGDLRRLMGEVEDRGQWLGAADGELRRLMGQVEDRERRLGAADVELRRLMGEVEDRERRLEAADSDLRRLMGEVTDRQRRLEAADSDLRRLMGEVEDRNRRLEEADVHLRRLMGEVEDRDRRLGAADVELRRLIGEAEDYDQQLRGLIAEIGDRDRQLIAANEEQHRLSSLQLTSETNGWWSRTTSFVGFWKKRI